MSDDDMPDIGAMPSLPPMAIEPAVEEGDQGDDDDDELEDLLEDALEEAALEAIIEARVEKEPEPGPSPAAQPALQLPTLDDLPRLPDGRVDVRSLNEKQRQQYNGAVLSLLTEEQMARYESFKRTSLKEPMRKLIQVIVGGGNPKPADKSLIALAGVTKVFVGEVVEEARRVALELGAKGPLQPAHVHAAYQRLKERGIVEAAPPSRRKMKL